MDRYDIITVIGLFLIGLSLFFAFGWVSALAYAGIALLIVGIMGARG